MGHRKVPLEEDELLEWLNQLLILLVHEEGQLIRLKSNDHGIVNSGP